MGCPLPDPSISPFPRHPHHSCQLNPLELWGLLLWALSGPAAAAAANTWTLNEAGHPCRVQGSTFSSWTSSLFCHFGQLTGPHFLRGGTRWRESSLSLSEEVCMNWGQLTNKAALTSLNTSLDPGTWHPTLAPGHPYSALTAPVLLCHSVRWPHHLSTPQLHTTFCSPQ